MLDHHDQIAALEAEIEQLCDSARQCRKVALLAKIAATIGGVLLTAVVLGLVRSQPVAFVLGVAATLGGLVLLGSNQATLDEINAKVSEREARRARMIDQLALEPVGRS